MLLSITVVLNGCSTPTIEPDQPSPMAPVQSYHVSLASQAASESPEGEEVTEGIQAPAEEAQELALSPGAKELLLTCVLTGFLCAAALVVGSFMTVTIATVCAPVSFIDPSLEFRDCFPF